MEITKQRICNEFIRQSDNIKNLQHAFDLYEVAEFTELTAVTSACTNYFKKHLDSYESLNECFSSTSVADGISRESRVRITSIVLKKLVEKMYANTRNMNKLDPTYQGTMEIVNYLENFEA